MKGQMMAVAAVMVCGLTVLIMARSLILSLESTREAYYGNMHFGDVFCDLKRAPNSLRSRLEQIPGVAGVEDTGARRLVLDLPGMNEPADGTILSLPEHRVQQLNLVYLRTGRFPEIGARDEVVVSEAFADAHGFQPGDTIDATIYGHRERLRIVGIGLSPEYVIEARPARLRPRSAALRRLLDERARARTGHRHEGSVQQRGRRSGAGADASAVKAELERLLQPYGGLVAYDRTEHPSARQTDRDPQSARRLPSCFRTCSSSIAAFMTSAALTRLVRLQREQIAQLKASGYSSAQVGLHYLKFALVIVVIGTVVGALLGFLVGTCRAPVPPVLPLSLAHFHPNWCGYFVALGAGSVTSFWACSERSRQAVKLPPAEAMRPEPPADFRPSMLERIGLHRLVSPSFRMALRNLERKALAGILHVTSDLRSPLRFPSSPARFATSIVYLLEFQWSLGAASGRDAAAD